MLAMSRQLAVFFLLFLIGILAQPACAQKSSHKEQLMEVVVVTATRTRVPMRQVAAAATVITAPEIKRRQATDVKDLLREVAGLTVVQSGSRGGTASLFPRGGESNYTLVLIDGVKVNRSGGDYDFSSLTTDNIERIEVIRGPQSALYGSDAIGGVIQIFTKKGKGRPTASISSANGAHSENGNYIGEHKFSLAGGNESMGYSLAYDRIDDQGILKINNSYYNNTFSGRLDFYPQENLTISLTSRYQDSRFEIPTENGDRFDRSLDPDQFQKAKDTTVGLGMHFNPSPRWENVVQLGYHVYDTQYEDPFNPETDFSAFSSDTVDGRKSFDYHLNLRLFQGEPVHSIITAGYSYEEETFDQDSTSGSTSNSIDASRHLHGAYFQQQITVLDRLHLTGGFRVDHHTLFGTKVNPRGSIALEIKETGTKLRWSIATGIKAPTFIENFYSSPTAVGNPNLEPEESFSWEVGLDQYLLDDSIQLSATYFENAFDNLIAFDFLSTPNYLNIQKAESQGVEVSFRARPGLGLTLGGSYTYLNTRVTDAGGLGGPGAAFEEGKKLLRRPRHTFSIFADWLWRGLNLHASGNYVGDRDDRKFVGLTSTRVVNEEYFVLNLVASYTFKLGRGFVKKVKLFAKGRNILDRDYQEVLGYSSPRASAMAGVEFSI